MLEAYTLQEKLSVLIAKNQQIHNNLKCSRTLPSSHTQLNFKCPALAYANACKNHPQKFIV